MKIRDVDNIPDARSLLVKAAEFRNTKSDYMPPMTLGKPKAGTKNGKTCLAMDTAISNVLSGFKDELTYMAMPKFIGYAMLSNISQEALIRAGVETIADEMTRKFVDFTYDDDDGNESDKKEKLITEMQTQAAKYKLAETFNNALVKDGFFGGCLIYIDMGELDDEEAMEPLIFDKKTFKKGSFKGFKVIEPINIYPGTYNTNDPTDKDYFKPTFWYILGKRYHASRFIYIASNEAPLLLKPAYNFFGIPRAQLALDYVAQFVANRESAQELLNKFSLTCWKTNMTQVLQGQSTSDLMKRAKLFNKMKHNSGVMLLDKESEDMVQINTPLGGVRDIVDMSLSLLTAVWRIPKIKYIGEGEGGLNASSKEQMRSFYDFILSQKKKVLTQPMETVLKIFQLNLGYDINDALGFEFPSMVEMDDADRANLNKTQADRDNIYLANGVLSQEEVRQRLSMDKNSGYSMIDIDDVPEMPEEPLKEDKEAVNNETERQTAEDMAMDEEEPKEWITVHGNHIPLFEGESKEEALKNFFKKQEQKERNEKNETKNYFGRIQKESRGLSEQEIQQYHRNNEVDEGIRGRLSGILGKELVSRGYGNRNGNALALKNPKTGKELKIYSDVDAETFHDTFEIVQKYLPSGDAVDVHNAEEYKNCKNYLSENGLSGFSIAEDGNLISVFNLGEKGFLKTVAPIIKKEAKFLDCFNSNMQNLPEVYQKTLGFKPVSELEFNYDILKEDKGKEYADYFVETYGEAPVVFMVNTDDDVEPKKYKKDDYDGAYNNQRDYFKNKEKGTKTTKDEKPSFLQKVKGFFAKGFESSHQKDLTADEFKESEHPRGKDGRFENKSSELQEKAKSLVAGTKVVDEKGEPMVVYHGMPKDGHSHESWRFYLTEGKDVADTYKKGDGKVIAGYVDVKNLIEFDFEGGFFSKYKDGRTADEIALEVAKEGKYDGIKFSNVIDVGSGVKSLKNAKPTNEYVIFDPTKFKGFKVED